MYTLFQTATSPAGFQRDVESMASKLTTEVLIYSLVYFNCYTRYVSQQTVSLMTIQSDLRKMIEVAAVCFVLGGSIIMEWRRKTQKNEQVACFSLHWNTKTQTYLETKYRKSLNLLLIIWWQHCHSNVTCTTLRHEQLLRSKISDVKAHRFLDFCIYVHIARAVFEGYVW